MIEEDDDDIYEDDGEATKILSDEKDTLKIDLAKAQGKEAVLIVIRGNPQGKSYFLGGEELILGRDSDVAIQVNDGNVSRNHAKITSSGSDFFIEDLGSRNGSYLNDKRLSGRVKLAKEDMIRIGTTILKFLPAGAIEILYHTKMKNAAHMDDLTEIYNRNFIMEAFQVEFKRAKALHSSFPIILFDIDNFKKINDTYGHDAGDYILKELARIIRESGLRERDIFGRYGGEEFLILTTNSTLKEAEDAAERVRSVVDEHDFNYSEEHIHVTISLGVANVKKEHENFQMLYKAADKALYESKHNGKNRVTVDQ